MYFSFIEITLKGLYNILTHIAAFHIKIAAIFNNKIKLGVKGRAKTFAVLKDNITIADNVIWFHCASLGEYEQGLPVFEEIKASHPNHKIVLSFFSPSGYEIRKNAPIADCVVYLPLDTKQNAKQFLDLVHPELVVFVKYEIWPNYLLEIKKRQIKAVLISALFRKNQSFFKPTGKWMQKALFAFNHIFVQNEESKELLKQIDYNEVTVSGDTRFDRVSNQLNINNKFHFVETFKQDNLCVVAGSTWPEDEALLIDFINNDSSKTKYIIAPHNIKSGQISSLKSKLNKGTILYSEKDTADLAKVKVLIVNTIGLLSKIYSYADIAYVGGAMGSTGLHNTLEPAVFGVPIIIGYNHNKFPEAKSMISNKGMFSIKTQEKFDVILNELINDAGFRIKSGQLNADYISKNRGAVKQIMSYLNKR
ncbi:glycosyltransferase N-terminal domain-containing protein [Gaetbulibacter sp. S0825]|uniref:3-deoxy-D-manno-octulosonic acid transferase n=1 Tax=Gaetbulibacter sp. S0825 TaxID=2720084 RepID=UPI001431033C|nr:glycosyltransferase N-terminal domain-containing protein [Gaetbulibacter sp. S0825]NIX64194.1 3-deoxy-D-manno-octulosonic acid transferase [Gaetbulibacter sp. S0825]